MKENAPGESYIDLICGIYGDAYDDREEDSRIGGESWEPGKRAGHKSIRLFQEELKTVHGIRLSRCKIQKILITGHRWSTERSREIATLFESMTSSQQNGGNGMVPEEAIREIAARLDISAVSVLINLPYYKGVYSLDEKTANAKRIERCRAGKKGRVG